MRRFFEPEIRVISPTYTVHNLDKGLSEIQATMCEAGVLDDQGNIVAPKPLLFVGSSTGALFAEMLAAKYRGRVVAINPVTDPAILQYMLGPCENYRTGVKYEFTRGDLATFTGVRHQMELLRLVLVDSGDDVIDHTLTKVFYRGQGRYIEYPGCSHRFSFFTEALPEIRALYLE